MDRRAGIFLHPTSLPSKFGIGDFGEQAYHWIDLLNNCNQGYWQVLPMGPTGYGYSPYLSESSFAGNVLMISPSLLREDGLLTIPQLDSYPHLSEDKVDFKRVEESKNKLLKKAYENFDTKESDFVDFCHKESWWLEDYSMFALLKKTEKGAPWYEWPKAIRTRDSSELKKIKDNYKKEIDFFKFLQYQFSRQWKKLKKYANNKNVKIFGDVPYYAAHDSCDAWASPEIFNLNKNGKPKMVGGVPPDYFSNEGQLWGNPVYNWREMKRNRYIWWQKRISKILSYVDVLRIDHFRGLESYWAVPYGSKNAINGKWIKAPGQNFFKTIEEDLGELELIAEDLGVITEEVNKLRKNAKLPGMKILHFAFDKNPKNPYLPHNYESDSVVYTGTHDNDTTLGWYNSQPEEIKHLVREYLSCDDSEVLYEMIRVAYASVADLCIIPLQDILMLSSEHRMNQPGTGENNWVWRFTDKMLEGNNMMSTISKFARIYGRCP